MRIIRQIDGMFRKCMYGAHEGLHVSCEVEAVWVQTITAPGGFVNPTPEWWKPGAEQRYVCEEHKRHGGTPVQLISDMIKEIRHNAMVRALEEGP